MYPPFSFFTTRVHINDENVLTPAFLSQLDPLLLFVDQQIGFGAAASFFTFVDLFFEVKNVDFYKK